VSEVFGKFSEIGTLYITEVYHYYEYPLHFLCENESEHKYLVLTIEGGKRWILIPISSKRLLELKLNKVSGRDVYRKAETGRICCVNNTTSGLKTEWKDSSEIPDNNLPRKGVYLNLRKDSEYLRSSDDILFREQQFVREITP
jgi:hypothetical protein